MTTPDLEARLATIRKAITDLTTARAAIIGTMPTQAQIDDSGRLARIPVGERTSPIRSYAARTDVAWQRVGEAIDQLKFAAERVGILLDQANDHREH